MIPTAIARLRSSTARAGPSASVSHRMPAPGAVCRAAAGRAGRRTRWRNPNRRAAGRCSSRAKSTSTPTACSIRSTTSAALAPALKTHGGYDPENILEMTDQSINPREQPLKANLTIELPAWLKKRARPTR